MLRIVLQNQTLTGSFPCNAETHSHCCSQYYGHFIVRTRVVLVLFFLLSSGKFLCLIFFFFFKFWPLSCSEPDYQVYLNASKVPEFSDDLTELECRIVDMKSTEASIRFTVSWYYRLNRRSDDVVASELLAVMNGDWTLKYGERSKQRAQDGDFIFSKEHADTFNFRIQRTTEEDRGNYYCVVSAWTRQRNDSWVKSKDVFSKPVNIFWASEGRRFFLIHIHLGLVCLKSSHCAFSEAQSSCRFPFTLGVQKTHAQVTVPPILSMNPFTMMMLRMVRPNEGAGAWWVIEDHRGGALSVPSVSRRH